MNVEQLIQSEMFFQPLNNFKILNDGFITPNIDIEIISYNSKKSIRYRLSNNIKGVIENNDKLANEISNFVSKLSLYEDWKNHNSKKDF